MAVGGDGTMNEVINGYFKHNEQSQNKVSVGLLAMGTGSDLCRSLIPRAFDEALSVLRLSKWIAVG